MEPGDAAEDGRWARLFADLDSELAAAERAELEGEAADRTRREAALLTIADRLRGALGHPVRLRVRGLGELPCRLEQLGPDWLLGRDGTGGSLLVPLAAVLAVTGLAAASQTGDRGLVAARLDLRFALRGLVRDRASVRVTLIDTAELSGTLDRVGADFVELAEHPTGELRRAGRVRQVRLLPTAALAVVRAQ